MKLSWQRPTERHQLPSTAPMQGASTLHIYSPAALAEMPAVLGGGAPIQLLPAALVTPDELIESLPKLLHSSEDILFAAQIPTLLRTQAKRAFAVGMTLAGIDFSAAGLVPTFGIGGWDAATWLQHLEGAASNHALAQQVSAAARELDATGFVSIDSMRHALLGLRREWRQAGVSTLSNNSYIDNLAARLLGRGDEALGRRISAAIGTWQAQCAQAGAGQVPGLGIRSNSDAHLAAWRAQLEGWGAPVAAAFNIALAAGASIQQLASRWAHQTVGGRWQGDLSRASAALQQALASKPHKKQRLTEAERLRQ